MKDLIIRLFGEYQPVTTQELLPVMADGVTEYQMVEVVASGAAGVDWAWIAGVVLFAIVLYSLFRLLGVFFK